ncbi:HlyD family type I secretion periplasmic adaptor subunit [Pseudomonas sp. NBRC 100443]|nr:HlyD family type I secretion periplasmic adaptor subunit [Pseudomonas sp. NBRC 100443]
MGEIDVVATATGKIVPSGKSKVIQPSEVAVVKAIHVYDGQKVKAGDLLVELDSQITGADVERIRSDLLAAQIDVARASVLLDAIQTNREPTSLAGLIPQASTDQQVAAQRWLQGQYLELKSSLDQIDAEIDQRSAEIQAGKATIASLEESLPITRQLAADYKKLLDRGILGKHAWLQREKERLDQEREYRVQQSKESELLAAKMESERRRQSVLAQTQRAMLDLQHESSQKVTGLVQELRKAEQRDHLMRLTSPVDGTVQQLAIHTDGGVVTEAQPLMVIVPSDQPVEVEAMLENKDIGFVAPGQKAEIKVETFNFTKYGTARGEVISISNDAIEDERKGLLYGARVKVDRGEMDIDGRKVSLSPGMLVSVEIKTNHRKIIDYFLSPLQQHLNESLDER